MINLVLSLLPKKQPLTLLLTLLSLVGCLAQADTQPTPSSAPDSGLEGSISLHAIQGGPVKLGVPDSKPLADTTFVVKQGDLTVTSFTTDKQGNFRVSLPPGHYSISKKGWSSRVGFYGPFAVDVTAGQFKKVQLDCDTGMR
jgi:hypothetical protein